MHAGDNGTAAQAAAAAAAAVSRQELAAFGGWGPEDNMPMQGVSGVAVDSGNGKRKFDAMDAASQESSPGQDSSRRGRTLFRRFSSLVGSFSLPFRWPTTKGTAKEEDSSSTFEIPAAHRGQAAFFGCGTPRTPGQPVRPLEEPLAGRMATGDLPGPSGATSSRAFAACGTSRETLGANQGQSRWSVQQSITEVMDAVAVKLSSIGKTALFGFMGSRQRSEGPVDALDELRDLSGFSEGFQRPFTEQPQYMSLTMSGLGQVPMPRAGFRPGSGPVVPLPANVAGGGGLQECACCGTATSSHQKDKQSLWTTSQQIHGAPQYWPCECMSALCALPSSMAEWMGQERQQSSRNGDVSADRLGVCSCAARSAGIPSARATGMCSFLACLAPFRCASRLQALNWCRPTSCAAQPCKQPARLHSGEDPTEEGSAARPLHPT